MNTHTGCLRAPCAAGLHSLRAGRPAAAVATRAASTSGSLPLYSKCSLVAGTPLCIQLPGKQQQQRRQQQQQRRQQRQRQQQQQLVTARVKDPDADEDAASALKGPPTMAWKVAAALTYLIPWIDTIALGREIYHTFPSLLWLYFFPGPSVKVYYSSQFAPLVIFFLLFLTIVKNTKLHHFVRFNCMQAVMLDIVCMLFHIVRAYFPAEIRWSGVLLTFDKFAFIACMTTIVYCVYFTLRGKYADIPFVSESVYMQVDASEYA